MTEKGPRRIYAKEIKTQIVKLYDTGKSRVAIIQEYDLSPSSFDTWLKQSRTSGSFSEKDNRTPEENELIQLRKDNQSLMMVSDSLDQEALIRGRR